MKLQKILNAINEGIDKALLNFDNDVSSISFNKSHNDLNQIIKKNIYGFQNCKIGDIIYINDELGYNLVKGEPFAECVIEKGMIDNTAHFWWVHELNNNQDNKYGNMVDYNEYHDFENFCKTHKEFRIPTKKEFAYVMANDDILDKLSDDYYLQNHNDIYIAKIEKNHKYGPLIPRYDNMFDKWGYMTPDDGATSSFKPFINLKQLEKYNKSKK